MHREKSLTASSVYTRLALHFRINLIVSSCPASQASKKGVCPVWRNNKEQSSGHVELDWNMSSRIQERTVKSEMAVFSLWATLIRVLLETQCRMAGRGLVYARLSLCVCVRACVCMCVCFLCMCDWYRHIVQLRITWFCTHGSQVNPCTVDRWLAQYNMTHHCIPWWFLQFEWC